MPRPQEDASTTASTNEATSHSPAQDTPLPPDLSIDEPPSPPLASLSPTQRTTLQSLHTRLSTLTSPTARNRLISETYQSEIAKHGPNSKLARRLQSGVWQGGAAGAGIGVGTAMGAGAVVGTVVGGVVSVPATLLGGVVGMAVGGVRGPMVRLDWETKGVEREGEDAEGEAVEAEGDGKGETEEGRRGRRKPRKLEIRSQNGGQSGSG